MAAGIAWREGCLPRATVAADGAAWVAHALELGGLPGPTPWADHWTKAAHPAGGCPLCGLGEFSAEPPALVSRHLAAAQ
eukprot:2210348-Alexandrium_andersonii.AAC.1